MAENTLTPVRRGGLVPETLEQLKRVILSGELPEGAPLREVHLAERLGVSRVPVREALLRAVAFRAVAERAVDLRPAPLRAPPARRGRAAAFRLAITVPRGNCSVYLDSFR